MLFNSYSFILFLPVMLLLYYLSSVRWRQIFLLIGSYFFYCYAYPLYGLLLLFSTVLDYCIGLLLYRAKTLPKKKFYLLCSMAGNLGVLAFFKYADFIGESLFGFASLFTQNLQWESLGYILPVGISFYTFQTMSYTIEIYRGKMKPTKDLIAFGLYVSFFPQLVAGPIERAPNLLPQLLLAPNARAEDVILGIRRILWGLIKKVVLADRLAFLVNHVYNNPHNDFSSFEIWVATYAFAFQIYFDFSGYSDIAIGTARLFGIRLMENFNLPYLAQNISEFWRRWHISFSTWLRDYLYIPLGGSRKGKVLTLLNVCIVMFLGGLWHGAAWNFVFWGLYQGVLLVFYHSWNQRSVLLTPLVKSHSTFWSGLKRWIAILVTFHFACIGWVLFRANSLADAWFFIKKMVFITQLFDDKMVPGIFLFLWIMVFFFICQIIEENFHLLPKLDRANPFLVGSIFSLFTFIIIIAGVSTSEQFIYFQF